MLNNEIQIKKSKKRLPKNFYKFIFFLVLAGMLIAGQSYMLSAYEAHVINVTAKICRYSETRTIGFWKNHQEVYAPYIPTFLGDSYIGSPEAADEVFQNANAEDMSDMLRAQLLAMKFNIAHFGVGEYEIIGWGTVSEVVALADYLLTPPYGTREEMEQVKNVLDYVNNLHKLTHCIDINPEFEPTFAIEIPADFQFSQPTPEVTGAMMELEILEIPPEPVCGDGVVNHETEECDDGNLEDNDGCSATCIIELPLEPEPVPEPEPEPEPEPICGDGVVNQETEQCDAGLEGSETCTIDCTIIEPLLEEPPIEEEPPVEEEPTPVCGDGVVNQEEEQCDVGLEGSETCTPDCIIIEPEPEPEPICGDGVVNQETEECDDGSEGSETCTIDCTIIEPEPEPEPEPVCGNGVLEGEEECDDGNLEDNDGCNSVCILEETL